MNSHNRIHSNRQQIIQWVTSCFSTWSKSHQNL